jgi:hypothetical protein
VETLLYQLGKVDSLGSIFRVSQSMTLSRAMDSLKIRCPLNRAIEYQPWGFNEGKHHAIAYTYCAGHEAIECVNDLARIMYDSWYCSLEIAR